MIWDTSGVFENMHSVVGCPWLLFIVARTVQPWNNIDLPDPVGKTPITSWPFRIDSKDFNSKWFKIKRWKVAVTQGKSDPAKHWEKLWCTRHLRCFVYGMRSYANLVRPQILGVWWSCDRPMPGPFPAPPPKPWKSALIWGRGWDWSSNEKF